MWVISVLNSAAHDHSTKRRHEISREAARLADRKLRRRRRDAAVKDVANVGAIAYRPNAGGPDSGQVGVDDDPAAVEHERRVFDE